MGLRELKGRLLTWRVAAGWYAVALLAAPVVWLLDRTGSLLLTMIMHGSLSATTAMILAPDVTGGRLAVYYLAVGALMWAAAVAVVIAHRSGHGNRSLQPEDGNPAAHLPGSQTRSRQPLEVPGTGPGHQPSKGVDSREG